MHGKFNIEAFRKEVVSVFGGTKIVVTYDVEHIEIVKEHKFKNSYEVKAEIDGINDFSPEIRFTEVTGMPSQSNEETVTAEVLLETLQSCTTGELCGAALAVW